MPDVHLAQPTTQPPKEEFALLVFPDSQLPTKSTAFETAITTEFKILGNNATTTT